MTQYSVELLPAGTHKKHIEAKATFYKKTNVFFSVIPPNMTGMLQPLDVAVNRSFQQYYGDKYNEFMGKAVQNKDASLQTKSGNVKMPKYSEISVWIADWMKTQTTEKIAKAFKLCGLVPSANFSLTDLHQPLRDCFKEDFSLEQWEINHAAAINNSPDNEEVYDDVILYDMAFSFYKALYESIDNENEEGFEFWCDDFKEKVITFINGDQLLKSMYSDDERILLESGKTTGTFIEMFAAAKILKVKLSIIEIDEEGKKIDEHTWNESQPTEIHLMYSEELFGIKDTDADV